MNFKSYSIVFNGEIYNFSEIRNQLEEAGYSFVSHSDTEVILKAFDHWGPKAVNHFIGMFAFALFDSGANKLWLFRDRAGVKPLYYYSFGNVLLFASELKAFHKCHLFQKKLDLTAVQQFLQLGYIPAPRSIFENVFKLEPGHYLEFDLSNRESKTIKYWDILSYYNKPKLSISFEEAQQEAEKLLVSAFQYRTVADVPVGVFLSGGYDSTAVAAILQKHSSQKVKTYSIGFNEPRYNEAHHAKSVASYLGTEHIELYCSMNDAQGIVHELSRIWDEPFGDNSTIPTILVSRLAAKEVKVALSADAGDELFAGYPKYTILPAQFKKMSLVPPVVRKMIGKIDPNILQLLLLNSYNREARAYKLPQLLAAKNVLDFSLAVNQSYSNLELSKLMMHFQDDLKYPSFTENVDLQFNDNINSLLAVDFKNYMVDDVLTKVDRATMSVSLEGREPLLDHRIAEFAAQLPSTYKYNNGTSKMLLKSIVHKYVPRDMMDRPKMGFSAPVETWLRNDLAPLLHTYLDEGRVKKHGVLNPQYVRQLKADFLAEKKISFNRLWYVLTLQMWLDEWM